MTDEFCSGWFALVLVLARQHLMLVHIRVAAMQTGQELMDILFSSYRIADGYFCSASACYGGCLRQVAGAGVGGGPHAVRVGVPEHAAQHDDEAKHGDTYRYH